MSIKKNLKFLLIGLSSSIATALISISPSVDAQTIRHVKGQCSLGNTIGGWSGTCEIKTWWDGEHLVVELQQDFTLTNPRYQSETRGRKSTQTRTMRLHEYERCQESGWGWEFQSNGCLEDVYNPSTSEWRTGGCRIQMTSYPPSYPQSGQPLFSIFCGNAYGFRYQGELPMPSRN